MPESPSAQLIRTSFGGKSIKCNVDIIFYLLDSQDSILAGYSRLFICVLIEAILVPQEKDPLHVCVCVCVGVCGTHHKQSQICTDCHIVIITLIHLYVYTHMYICSGKCAAACQFDRASSHYS